ncbi:MAG: radical SAM protein [Thermodesulfobacteriota bacterium]
MSRSDFNILAGLFQPRLDWIQVEVTSHCNAACIYCPRTAYRGSWENRHLSMSTFQSLARSFKMARLIHLQGWGEPFLNPHFFEMAAAAKDAGCRVGTTTNAGILDPDRIARLVESRIDLIAFSLAGTGVESDEIRRGTRLEKVLETIAALTREKERLKAAGPEIHIAYMLFRSGLDRLRQMPGLVKGLGVSDVVITTLDMVACEDLLEEAIHPRTEAEHRELASYLDSVVADGERQGVKIHYHLAHPERSREVCTENVTRALCVASDGAVTPCVFTNLRVEEALYLAGGEKKTYRRLSLGNVNEKPLAEIWRSKDYKAFRASFKKGPLAEPCQGCPKLR